MGCWPGSQRVTPTPSLGSDELPIAPTIIFLPMTHNMTTLWQPHSRPALIPVLIKSGSRRLGEKERGAQVVCCCHNLFTHRSASEAGKGQGIARGAREELVDTQRGKNSDKAPGVPLAARLPAWPSRVVGLAEIRPA